MYRDANGELREQGLHSGFGFSLETYFLESRFCKNHVTSIWVTNLETRSLRIQAFDLLFRVEIFSGVLGQ